MSGESNEKKGFAAMISDDKDRLLDVNGLRTGAPLTKKTITTLIIAIVLFFALRALPLSEWGELTSTALALLVSIIVLFVGLNVSFVVPAILAAVLGVFLKLWDFNVVKTTIGTSTFPMMLGMTIVAMGCEYTPMGKRLAYLMLRIFGQRPVALIVAIGIVTALLSAFVSNNAVIIMMSSICAGMLVEMKQVPGQSKLGKAIMILTVAASMIGGGVLITGSPIGNGTGISMLNEASGGLVDVSFVEWAKIGVPAFIILAVPMGLVYAKWFGVKNKDYTDLPSTSYYQEKLDELGHITGSEIRWILTVVGMVWSMSAGMNMSLASLLWAVVAMAPVVGTVPSKAVLKKMPWNIIITAAFIPILGQCISTHGIGNMVVHYVAPLFSDMGPFAFCLFCTAVQGVLCNLFNAAPTAAMTLGVGLMTPICVSLGYNPAVVLLPIIIINSCHFVFGFNMSMMMTYDYGYWEVKETTLPGIICLAATIIAFCVSACLIAPLFGASLYL